jgi:hypothetical protein
MTLLSVLAGSSPVPSDVKAFGKARRSHADELARALIGAREACREIAVHSKRKDKQLAATNRNQGAKDKAEFVLTFAEVWTALTTRLPPTSRNRNDFLDLLAAGWRDAGHATNEDFSRAIRDARATVESQLVGITSLGPWWLR